MIDPAVISSLADEGVPIAAIARAAKMPSDEVRDVVRDAVTVGTILMMPKEDWPPGQRREDRIPALNLSPDFDTAVMDCIRVFKLARLQGRVLAHLLLRPQSTKEQLHQVIEQTRDPTKDATDMKMVDVVVCKLRQRLKNFGLEIKTIWGCGYFMEPSMQAKARELIAGS